MEEKERYEVMSPSLNGYAYIHDFKTDNVLNTYDSCDLLNQQSKRIKELEKENKTLIKALNGEVFINYKLPMENAQHKQQLAEKKKEIADLQSQLQQANEIINNPDTLIFQQQELIDNLQSQLAEKDKEISNLNGLVRERDKQIKNLKTNKKKVIEHKNKTKISFALEQLEKVKDYCNENIYSCSYKLGSLSIFDFIDNQINELKGKIENEK